MTTDLLQSCSSALPVKSARTRLLGHSDREGKKTNVKVLIMAKSANKNPLFPPEGVGVGGTENKGNGE